MIVKIADSCCNCNRCCHHDNSKVGVVLNPSVSFSYRLQDIFSQLRVFSINICACFTNCVSYYNATDYKVFKDLRHGLVRVSIKNM